MTAVSHHCIINLTFFSCQYLSYTFTGKMHADSRVLHFIAPKTRRTLEELLQQRRMMSLKKKLPKKGDESSYWRLINQVLHTVISFDIKRVFIGLI